MSIISQNGLESIGYRPRLTNKLQFYKGDRLKLSFSLTNKIISEIDSNVVVDGILPINSPNVETFMLIEGKEVAGTIIENNNVVFLLETDRYDIGETLFQIVIVENNEDGSKEILHTPPFPIEIQEPIGYVDTDQARVGYAIVGKSRVAAEPIALALEIDEGYTMTVWQTGDLITADRLNNIERALDSLLYKAITISNFTISKSIAEYGEVLNNITLSWSFSKPITYQRLDGVELDIDLRRYDIPESITSNRNFKMECSDGRSTASRTVGISFFNGRYHGVSSESIYDNNFIMQLTKTLTNTRQNTFNVSCGDGQYVYFAIPTRFGTPTFSVGGFSGGFVKVSSLDFTNKFGYTEPYDIWKSENSNLGKIAVVVG